MKALAVAGAVLDQPRYIDAATRAAEFTATTMTTDDGRLLHAFRGGKAHLPGFVDDYAITIEAYIALFHATGKARWIGRATKLAESMIAHFSDTQRGGFYYTADDGEALIARTKDWHDGSMVSGNAAAASGLLTLSRLCDRDDFRDAAMRTVIAGGEVLRTQHPACSALVSVLDRIHHPGQQLVLAVADMASMQKLRTEFVKPLRPHATLSWVIGEAPDTGPVVGLNANRGPIDGQPTLYRCQNFTCDAPLVGEAVTAALSQA